MTKLLDATNLGGLATFMPNKFLPVYNWLYYKEGYAKQLVFLLLDEFKIKKGDTVLDPFCGVGTTSLACKEKGVNSVAFDVNEVALFASKVKTREYNIEELEEAVKKLFKSKFKRIDYKPQLNLIKKA